MRIILYGPPGSGKGTQGDLIEKKYGFPKVSTGDLLRRAVRERTLLGLKADGAMRQGLLVSDDIVLELLKERISQPDCRLAYVLDGYPRNIGQALSLELLETNRPETFIEIQVDEETLVARLSARRICSRCGAIYSLALRALKKEGECDLCSGDTYQRPDDRPEVIRERFRVYEQETEKIREYYRARNVYHAVDGSAPEAGVFVAVSALIDSGISRRGEARVVR
jgi:adenylate kinase